MTQRYALSFVKAVCTLALLAPVGGIVQAQQFSITAGSINTCTGVLEDSGGPSAEYGNNENYTAVICPDVPGDAITLTWAVFNLSTTGPNPLDRIRIWDGDNTGATFLGEYTGTQLQGLIAAATTFNPTGCLTVQFISNGAGTGDFAAVITCFTPCERPTAVASMSQASPALVCMGEVLQFDGSASYAASGFSIASYEWVFADGTTANGPTASHAFSEPGEYIVQLNLIDDNNCVNSNVVDLQVLVSTTPIFLGTSPSLEVCLGSTVDLTGVAEPVTWTGIPDANFGDGVYLPDDVGTPFSSELVFTQFDPGQTLTNVNDLLSICVSMEHSYLGDLVLSVTCPNGQNIIMHQQGGGGTYIGGANDTDNANNPVPGECWDYCWTPNATWGTFAQSAAFGATPNVMPGGTPSNNALIPGDYSSLQPWSNLAGCPLNGTWTFTSLDLWGADNGFLCSWSLNFNPAIIPAVTQFTPVLDLTDPDSTYWSGPFGTPNTANPTQHSFVTTQSGQFPFVFTVVDNFGCAYDTTITVTVQPPMVIDAGPDIVLCSDPLPMAGQVVANGPPENCTWNLVLFESFGDTWNGGASLAVIIDGVSTSYTISNSGVTQLNIPLSVTTGASITLQYTAGTNWNNENSFDLFDDLGNLVYASPNGPPTGMAWSGTITCDGGASPTVWQWTPATGLDDAGDPTTNVFTTQPTWYHLVAYPAGSPECAVTDSVLVSPDPSINAGLDAQVTVCSNDPAFSLTASLDGTPDIGGVWTELAGTVVADTFDPLTGASGIYTYTVTSAAGCQATSTLEVVVIPSTDPTCCGVADAGEPAYSCDLTIALSATPGNTGVGNWTGPQGAIFADASSPQTTVTMPPGGGGTHWFYWVEDDNAFCYLIDSVQMTLTDAITIAFTHTDAVCYTYCDGTAQAAVAGGNAAAGMGYQWSTGAGGVDVTEVTGLCAGTYTLTVTDDNGCSSSAQVTIGEPPLLEVDLVTSLPVTCSGDCDGQVEVHDAAAVEYSFDGGASWTASPVLANVCEGMHPVQIRDIAGCIGNGSVVVTGPPPVVADFGWGPIPATIEDPTIHFATTSTGSDHYLWDIAGMMSTTDPTPSFTFTNREPGTYRVCLTAFNQNQCQDSICHMVTIDDILFTYIPNSFTPDGDGHNETWGMSTNIAVITKFQMHVFDRWGQVVYESIDPYIWWNGGYRNSGEVLKSDIYAYRITYEIRGTEVSKELTGHVSLLK